MAGALSRVPVPAPQTALVVEGSSKEELDLWQSGPFLKDSEEGGRSHGRTLPKAGGRGLQVLRPEQQYVMDSFTDRKTP